MYIWTDTAPAKIINLHNCISIEADEENNELWAIGNDGERYFLHRFEPENDEDSHSVINAIRAVYDYLEEGCQVIDMSDIVSKLRQITPPIDQNPDQGQTKRRPPKRLRVTLKDNTVIEHTSQRKTFFEAIEVAGIEQVHALRLGSVMHPLVERKNTDEPPGEYRHSDTSGFYSLYGAYHAKKKEDILNTISTRLGLQWNVEVSDSVEMEAD